MRQEKAFQNPHLFIVFADKIRKFYESESANLEKIALKPAKARILHFLADFEGLSQQDVGDFFNLRPSSVSGLLSGVEAEGYIVRRTNPQNRRMVQIHLTPKGQKTAQAIYNFFEDYCRRIMENFTQEEIREFERLLIKFNG
jgi:DNA-binding MarR family transcriptional regulator